MWRRSCGSRFCASQARDLPSSAVRCLAARYSAAEFWTVSIVGGARPRGGREAARGRRSDMGRRAQGLFDRIGWPLPVADAREVAA
ncbi:hypothetical protein GCM10010170_036550 [Dactylosporangium salmoneum]|uniref:Uncharacterized protein n=1 Tax=Dactylosporangium salmoneum TaxID=53361 RepID=A0ABN3GBS3_9ACTN